MIYMCIDYGNVRIGLATSDATGRIASPYKTIDIQKITTLKGPRATDSIAQYLAKLIKSKNAKHVVIGMPLSLEGDDSIMSLKARTFMNQLRKHTSVPLTMFDERYTSKAATRALRSTGMNTKKMRGRVDEIAAAIMLQSFLDGVSDDIVDMHDDLSI